MKTEYQSQSNNLAFLSFGPEETVGGPPTSTWPVASVLRLRIEGFPNPSPGASSIRYSIPQAGPVRVSVYDIAGRLVATLVDRRVDRGTWTTRWNGRTDSGAPAATGMYFLRVQTPQGSRASKLTLVR